MKMEKNWKLSNLAKLHAIQNMMEGEKLPKPIDDFFKDIEQDLEILNIIFNHIEIPLGKNTCYLIDKDNLTQEEIFKLEQAFN